MAKKEKSFRFVMNVGKGEGKLAAAIRVQSPSGKLLAVCDKGMDRIYTYRINTELGKLKKLDEWITGDVASFPRYGAFHPELPIFCANNENYATLNCFRYEEESGKLEHIRTIELLKEDPGLVDGKPVGPRISWFTRTESGCTLP